MRTLHVGLRASSLSMLQLPGDAFVTIELVQWPAGHADGIAKADFS